MSKLFTFLFSIVVAFGISRADIYLAKNIYSYSPILLLSSILSLGVIFSLIIKGASAKINVFFGFQVLFFLSLGFIGAAQLASQPLINIGNLNNYILPISYLLLFVLFYMCFSFKLINFRVVLSITFLVVVASVFIEAVTPGIFSKTYYRASGIAENPNLSAMIVCLSVLMLLNFERFLFKDIVLVSLGSLAILFSASRAGLLIYFIICISWAAFMLFRLKGGELIKAVVTFFTAFIVMLFLLSLSMSSPLFESERTRERVSLSSQGDVLSRDSSRIEVIGAYFEEMDTCLPFPCGIFEYYGSEMHAHNTSINYAYQYGLPFLFLALLPVFITLLLPIMYQRAFYFFDRYRVYVATFCLFLFSMVNNDIYAQKIVLLILAFYANWINKAFSEKFGENYKVA